MNNVAFFTGTKAHKYEFRLATPGMALDAEWSDF